MGTNPSQFLMWPYEELKISQGPSQEFFIECPWIKLRFFPDDSSFDRTKSLTEKIQSENLSPEDLYEVSWFFRSFTDYPLAYILPRTQLEENLDKHQVKSEEFLALSPEKFLNTCLKKYFSTSIGIVPNYSDILSAKEWTWDLEAALEFSKTNAGHDPYTLLSLSRRFHLLDSMAYNKVGEVFEFVRKLNPNKNEFKKACALVVRQNHYVTQKCNESLAPALQIAQSAEPAVANFMKSELGHDVLLHKAVQELTENPETVPVVTGAKVLMELLKFSASRNLLSFALAVDIFERNPYTEEDPLATLLASGGFEKAAKHIDIHKHINDSESHENISLKFLEHVGSVDRKYVEEALRIAEMTTFVVHQLSVELLEAVQTSSSAMTSVS